MNLSDFTNITCKYLKKKFLVKGGVEISFKTKKLVITDLFEEQELFYS